MTCRRDIEATFQSCRETGMLAPNRPPKHLRRVLELHHDDMDYLEAYYGAARVDTEAVAGGGGR